MNKSVFSHVKQKKKVKLINTVIDLIKTTIGVPRLTILDTTDEHGEEARLILCYMVMQESVAVSVELAHLLNENVEYVVESARKAVRLKRMNYDFRNRITSVCNKRNHIKRNTSGKKSVVSNTKRLFGFDYTKKQKERMNNVIAYADMYMRKYVESTKPLCNE